VPRTRPPYPEEFKREAIELVRLTGKSVRQVAKDLGISEVSLRNWIKEAERDEGKRPDGLSSDEREELQRLRRENQTLRMEREILKKAAAPVPPFRKTTRSRCERLAPTGLRLRGLPRGLSKPAAQLSGAPGASRPERNAPRIGCRLSFHAFAT
jgi:transposase